MLISHKHRFVFIHIPKNAGTSITRALMPFSTSALQSAPTKYWNGRGQEKLNRQVGKINSQWNPQPLPSHARSYQVAEWMGESAFQDFFSFAIVRNPWDWQVSLYSFIRKEKSHYQHSVVTRLGSFEEYIRWKCAEPSYLQSDFVMDKSGSRQLVSFVGRFENISVDFGYITEKVGIQASLPVSNASSHKGYQSLYNDSMIELVATTFRKDIELFNYSF